MRHYKNCSTFFVFEIKKYVIIVRWIGRGIYHCVVSRKAVMYCLIDASLLGLLAPYDKESLAFSQLSGIWYTNSFSGCQTKYLYNENWFFFVKWMNEWLISTFPFFLQFTVVNRIIIITRQVCQLIFKTDTIIMIRKLTMIVSRFSLYNEAISIQSMSKKGEEKEQVLQSLKTWGISEMQ